MLDFIVQHDASIRLSAFVLILAIMLAWEVYRPARALAASRLKRWSGHLGLVITSIVLVRLLAPVALTVFALQLQTRQFGLFNWVDWPVAVEIGISVVALDLWIYWQHRLMHAVPILWRLHRVHHTDVDFDVTTAVRFHPVEIGFSLALKFLAVLLLGPPAAAVVIHEIILSCFALYNHGNVKLNPKTDQWLRRVIVTPDFHRVHHSTVVRETNSNYGNFLSVWDRLFRSYVAQPQNGHSQMPIGLSQYPYQKVQSFGYLLVLPVLPLKSPLSE